MYSIRRTPILNSVLMIISILISFLLSILIQEYFHFLSDSSIAVRIFLAVIISASVGRVLRLYGPFYFINIIFPFFMFIFFSDQNITQNIGLNWIWIIGAISLAGLHLPALWTHVPYYPTPFQSYQTIASLVPEDAISFADLGCGTGKLLQYVCSSKKVSKLYGYEISIFPYIIAKFRSLLQNKIKIRFCSFWSINWNQFDVIYCFLSPAPMSKVSEKFNREAKNGALLISNTFELPVTADTNIVFIKEIDAAQLEMKDKIRGTSIFLYKKIL